MVTLSKYVIGFVAICVLYSIWQLLKQLQVWRIERINEDYISRKQLGKGVSHSSIMRANDRLAGKTNDKRAKFEARKIRKQLKQQKA